MRIFDLSTLVGGGTTLAVAICAVIAVTLIYLWVNKDDPDAEVDRLITRFSLLLGYGGLVVASAAAIGASYLNSTTILLRVLLIVAIGVMIFGHHLMQKMMPDRR